MGGSESRWTVEDEVKARAALPSDLPVWSDADCNPDTMFELWSTAKAKDIGLTVDDFITGAAKALSPLECTRELQLPARTRIRVENRQAEYRNKLSTSIHRFTWDLRKEIRDDGFMDLFGKLPPDLRRWIACALKDGLQRLDDNTLSVDDVTQGMVFCNLNIDRVQHPDYPCTRGLIDEHHARMIQPRATFYKRLRECLTDGELLSIFDRVDHYTKVRIAQMSDWAQRRQRIVAA